MLRCRIRGRPKCAPARRFRHALCAPVRPFADEPGPLRPILLRAAVGETTSPTDAWLTFFACEIHLARLFNIPDSRFRTPDSNIPGSEFRLQSSGFRIQNADSGFRIQYPRDGGDDLLPAGLLREQLLLARRGQAIVLGPLVALCLLPLGRHPPLL